MVSHVMWRAPLPITLQAIYLAIVEVPYPVLGRLRSDAGHPAIGGQLHGAIPAGCRSSRSSPIVGLHVGCDAPCKLTMRTWS